MSSAVYDVRLDGCVGYLKTTAGKTWEMVKDILADLDTCFVNYQAAESSACRGYPILQLLSRHLHAVSSLLLHFRG